MAKKDDVTTSQEELDEMLKQAQEAAEQKDVKDAKDLEVDEVTPEDQIKSLEDQMLRSQAEMVNYRQRMEKEKVEFVKYAAKNVVLELLPVLDTFKMAVLHTPENLKDDNWVVGINHMEKQFEMALENVGVKKIKTVGEKVDYNLHEAVGQMDGEKDVIVAEVQSGYSLNGTIIRAAKVQVGKGE